MKLLEFYEIAFQLNQIRNDEFSLFQNRLIFYFLPLNLYSLTLLGNYIKTFR